MQVSIITPTLNSVARLQDCVKHVADRLPADAEHIIVDGASSDGTLECLASLSGKYSHLRYLSEKDNGQSQAMNRGIAIAKGDVIGFLNVDDAYCGQPIVRAVNLLRSLQEPSMVCGACRIVGKGGLVIGKESYSSLGKLSMIAGCSHPLNPACYFYHRSLHDIIGGYDENDNYTMDLDFLIRAASVVQFSSVDEVWGEFSWEEGAKTFEAHRRGDLEHILRETRQRHERTLRAWERGFLGAIKFSRWQAAICSRIRRRVVFLK